MAEADSERLQGHAEQALKVLDNLFGPVEQTAEYLYQRGATISRAGNNPSEVIALFERAYQLDGAHIDAPWSTKSRFLVYSLPASRPNKGCVWITSPW